MAEETQNTTNGGSGSTLMKVLCYFTYLWLIPFFVVKGEERTEGMITHLRQGFGTFILCVLGQIIGRASDFVGSIVLLCCAVLGLIGVINAVTGKDKELPIVGSFFQSSFTFIR